MSLTFSYFHNNFSTILGLFCHFLLRICFYIPKKPIGQRIRLNVLIHQIFGMFDKLHKIAKICKSLCFLFVKVFMLFGCRFEAFLN